MNLFRIDLRQIRKVTDMAERNNKYNLILDSLQKLLENRRL